MSAVTQYNYQFHGGANGYGGRRAIVRLRGDTGGSVAYLYFMTAGSAIPDDTDTGSWIRMYMPETALPGVIDMLRNEKPIQIYYASGSAFLRTGMEPVGEDE